MGSCGRRSGKLPEVVREGEEQEDLERTVSPQHVGLATGSRGTWLSPRSLPGSASLLGSLLLQLQGGLVVLSVPRSLIQVAS